MFKFLKKPVMLVFIFCSGCSGGSSNPSTTQLTTELSTSQMAFSFSDSKALALSDSTTIYETQLGSVTTNLSKILNDDTIAPAFLPSSSDSLSSATIKVSYFTYSPIGDVHIILNSPIFVNSENCYWISVNTDNQVSCVSVEPFYTNNIDNRGFIQKSSSSEITVADFIIQLQFDSLGNAFYSTEFENKIFKWNRKEESTSTAFNGNDINFDIYNFFTAPDESLIIYGVLKGLDVYPQLFRYIPSSGELEILCESSIFLFLPQKFCMFMAPARQVMGALFQEC